MSEDVTQIVGDVVMLRVVRRVVVSRIVVQTIVERVVLIAAEAEAQRVVDRVVQPVEAVQGVLTVEVVVEVSDLDVAAERSRAVRVMTLEVVEQTVRGRLGGVHLRAEAEGVRLRVVRAGTELVIVIRVILTGDVHSHDHNRPPLRRRCPGFGTEHETSTRISAECRRAASMDPWDR